MNNKEPAKSNALFYWSKLLLWKIRKRVVFGAILVFTTSAFAIALLALSGWFITSTAIAGISIAAGAMLALDIYLPGSGIRFFALGRTVSRYFERLYNHDSVLQQLSIARQQLFKGLAELQRSELQNKLQSDWLSRLTADLDSLDSLLLRLLLPPISALLGLLLLSVLISFWSWPAAIVLFTGTTVASALIFILFLRVQQNSNIELAASFNSARAEVINHLRGLPELRSARMQSDHQRSLMDYSQLFGQLQLRLMRLQANTQLAINVLHSLLVLATAVSVISSFQSGLISAPVAVLLVLAVFAFGELLQLLPSQLGQLGRTRYAAERLHSLAQASEHIKNNDISHDLRFESLILQISEHPFIKASSGKTLKIELMPTKPFVLISGGSGSGKSTLAELILGEGIVQAHFLGAQFSYTLDHCPIVSETQLNSLQRHIAYLSQQNSIVAGTLYTNLCLGLSNIMDEQLWKVLEMVELKEWATGLPHGLDSWMGDTGQQLSGGQARRICLARLLLRQPHLAVLDEPFNGLDKNMAERIWLNIKLWAENRFLVIILHEKPAFLAGNRKTEQTWQRIELGSAHDESFRL